MAKLLHRLIPIRLAQARELDLLPEWDQIAGIDVTPSKSFFNPRDLLPLPMFMPQIGSMDVDYGAHVMPS